MDAWIAGLGPQRWEMKRGSMWVQAGDVVGIYQDNDENRCSDDP